MFFIYFFNILGLFVISPLTISSTYVSCAFLTFLWFKFYLLIPLEFPDLFAFLCALFFLFASLLMLPFTHGLLCRDYVNFAGTCFSIIFSHNVVNDVQMMPVKFIPMSSFWYFCISSLVLIVSTLSYFYNFCFAGILLLKSNNKVSVRMMSWSLAQGW